MVVSEQYSKGTESRDLRSQEFVYIPVSCGETIVKGRRTTRRIKSHQIEAICVNRIGGEPIGTPFVPCRVVSEVSQWSPSIVGVQAVGSSDITETVQFNYCERSYAAATARRLTHVRA